MTLILKEQYDSGLFEQTEEGIRITRVFLADNPVPEEVLKQIGLVSTLPAPFELGDPHTTFDMAKIEEIKAQYYSTKFSLVTIVYRSSDIYNIENEHGETWSWDLSAQQTHINSVSDPLYQTNYGVDVGVAIGVNGNNVDGVDVYRPSMSLKVTRHVEDDTLLAAQAAIQARLAHVNSKNWKGYAPGEVLFIGAAINKVRTNDWLIEYNFLIGKIQTTPVITLADGSTVGPLTINPWNYVWFQHQTLTAGGELKRLIKSVHIAKVYEDLDFDSFGLKGP